MRKQNPFMGSRWMHSVGALRLSALVLVREQETQSATTCYGSNSLLLAQQFCKLAKTLRFRLHIVSCTVMPTTARGRPRSSLRVCVYTVPYSTYGQYFKYQ